MGNTAAQEGSLNHVIISEQITQDFDILRVSKRAPILICSPICRGHRGILWPLRLSLPDRTCSSDQVLQDKVSGAGGRQHVHVHPGAGGHDDGHRAQDYWAGYVQPEQALQ